MATTCFKLTTLVQSSLNNLCPQYLSSLLHSYSPLRQLRSASLSLLSYPQMPEPVIPLVDWHKLTYLVLTCHKTPINQSNLVSTLLLPIVVLSMLAFYLEFPPLS